MTPQQISELADSLDHAGATDVYTARYEAYFKSKGLEATEARTRAEAWAQLKTSMPEGSVIDPDLTTDDLIMQHRLQHGDNAIATAASGVAAPYQRYAAASSLSGPPSIMEPPPSRFFPISNGITINRYSANPGRDFYSQLLSGVATLVGDPPTMFASGDRPPFIASGLDPSTLAWIPWSHRHSASLTESRAQVLLLVEQGLAGVITPEDFQNAEGTALWNSYWQAIRTWVQTVPADEATASIDAQIAAVYGSGSRQ
jgi:hypothetical protein